jgi:hypothetical protein
MEPATWGVLVGVMIGLPFLLWQYFRPFATELWRKLSSIGSVLIFFSLVFTLPRIFLQFNSVSKTVYSNPQLLLPLFQTVGIIFSIWIGIYNIGRAIRLEKLRSLSDITKANRDLLTFYISNQEKLSRVFSNDLKSGLDIDPVSLEEKFYVNLLILHFNVIFNSIENSISPEIENLEIDIGGFLTLPLPNAVWNKSRIYQNKKFAAFVDSCIKHQSNQEIS